MRYIFSRKYPDGQRGDGCLDRIKWMLVRRKRTLFTITLLKWYFALLLRTSEVKSTWWYQISLHMHVDRFTLKGDCVLIFQNILQRLNFSVSSCEVRSIVGVNQSWASSNGSEKITSDQHSWCKKDRVNRPVQHFYHSGTCATQMLAPRLNHFPSAFVNETSSNGSEKIVVRKSLAQKAEAHVFNVDS